MTKPSLDAEIESRVSLIMWRCKLIPYYGFATNSCRIAGRVAAWLEVEHLGVVSVRIEQVEGE